jgi:hypothetical protein
LKLAEARGVMLELQQVSEGLVQMKIPAFQHLVAAIILSLIVAGGPFLRQIPTDKGELTRLILWFVAVSLTGILWMLFEGSTSPQGFTSWFAKLVRGTFFWGLIIGLLNRYLPIIFRVYRDSGSDYEILFLAILAIAIGFLLSLILSIYSYFFIKS